MTYTIKDFFIFCAVLDVYWSPEYASTVCFFVMFLYHKVPLPQIWASQGSLKKRVSIIKFSLASVWNLAVKLCDSK